MREDELDRLLSELRLLHLRTERVLADIDQLRHPTETAVPHRASSSPNTQVVFAPGDYVYIRNQIRHVPSGQRGSSADRAAIVERVTGNRVDIRTANGYATWRVAHNLRAITATQYNQYKES